MNYKDIEKEFDKGWRIALLRHGKTPFTLETFSKQFLKTKCNQIIEDMIGGKDWCILGNWSEGRRKAYKDGYNEKRRQLKEFKKKFNKL